MNAQRTVALLAAGLLIAGNAAAQLVMDTLNSAKVVDFQSDVGWSGSGDAPGDNVYRWTLHPDRTVTYKGGIENNSSDWKNYTATTGVRGLSFDAWSFSNSAVDFGGNGIGVRTPFGDYNNDGDFADALTGVTGISQGKTHFDAFGGSESASDYLIVGSGDGITDTNGDSRAFTMTLRVRNMTGGTVPQWKFGFDLWDRSTLSASQVSAFTIKYSTDNVNFTTLTSFDGIDGTSVWRYTGVDETFNASVADGGYLYLQLDETPKSGGGSAWLTDNWSVTAIPEPGTISVLLGAGGLMLLRRRMRRG